MKQHTTVALLLFTSAACKVQASASANIDTGASAPAVEVEASANVTAVQVRREGDELVFDGGEINFETDKATLVGDKTESTLRAYAQVLNDFPEIHLRVEGHTDSRASQEHNRKLSTARAKAVRTWLIDEAGIDKRRLTAEGHGESKPKVVEPEACNGKHASDAPPWCDEQVWSRNRRSEFHITEGAQTVPQGVIYGADEVASVQNDPGFNTGPYVYLSPGLLRVPVANRAETDARSVSYRWGLGAGYLWRRQRFIAGLGLGFAHVPVTIDIGSDRCAVSDCRLAHEFVLDAQLRLGGGSRRLVGYGLLGPGLAVGRSQRREGDTVIDFRTGGFNFDLGAGVWGLVWRGLFLGGEVALNVGAYARDDGAFHDQARVTGLDLRVLAGWHFGYKG